MNTLRYPNKEELKRALQRPALDVTNLFSTVGDVIKQVKEDGDEAIKRFEQKFDGVLLQSLQVSPEEFLEAEGKVEESLKNAIRQAYENIARFHEAQRFLPIEVETAKGVRCIQKAVPIEKVGLYVPGGTAPLFSTVLMLAVPAQIAGCTEIVLTTPPGKDGKVNPVVLFTARLAGVTKVYKVGGAQAVAAMAFGTESIPKVDKIFGPGNQYVMAAKQMVALYTDVAIDMPAGPSEVEVMADGDANPVFVAADLLSQAEHGPDSQVLLITTSPELIERVESEVDNQLKRLPRRETCLKAMEHSLMVLVKDMDEAVSVTNEYAPEHLVLAVNDYRKVAERITHAGSIFMGPYSCESAGDYASGTNHTLPTKGYAKAYSGLSLDSFQRKMTLQELNVEGILNIGQTVMDMAEGELLKAHSEAMRVRYDSVVSGMSKK